MTTTLTSPESGAALRILPISANLLPPEIVASRQGRRTRYAVLGALAGVVVLLVGWYAMAVLQTADARDGLTAVQSDAQRLTGQQKTYQELLSTQAKSDAIAAELHALLAKDLPWSTLLAALQGAAPRGLTVTGVTGVLTSAAAGQGTPRMPGVDPDQIVGTLTVIGTASGRNAVASYIDALAKVPGLANPLLTTASEESGVVHFSVRLDITKSRLGGRFATASASPSVAK